MAASKVSIFNSALVKLGQKTVMSADDDRASALQERYDDILKLVLSSHPWNFAINRQALQKLSTPPAFGFANQFQLPSDCLRVLAINPGDSSYSADYIYGWGQNTNNIWSDASTQYKLEGRKILTDNDVANLLYIKFEEDPTVYSPHFADALSTRLAAEVCHRIVGDKSRQNDLFTLYTTMLRNAKSIDATEDSPNSLHSDIFVNFTRR